MVSESGNSYDFSGSVLYFVFSNWGKLGGLIGKQRLYE